MGYIKSVETKIIKTTHIVEFHIGISANTLLDYLDSVPRGAIISDMEECEDARTCRITFSEEQEAT